MRILEQAGADFKSHSFKSEGAVAGTEAARLMGIPHERVFKTLVTVGKSRANFVFVIPVAKELNLKQAALNVGEKSIEMIKEKTLLPTTGYVHGGCSPIGMKKQFVTMIDESAREFDAIVFSAGRIGLQIEMNAEKLAELIGAGFSNLV